VVANRRFALEKIFRRKIFRGLGGVSPTSGIGHRGRPDTLLAVSEYDINANNPEPRNLATHLGMYYASFCACANKHYSASPKAI